MAKRFPWKSSLALTNHQSYKVTLGNEKENVRIENWRRGKLKEGLRTKGA